MSPDLFQADENQEDLQMLERHLDALKLVDNRFHSHSDYNPVPDDRIASNMNVLSNEGTGLGMPSFGNEATMNQSISNGSFHSQNHSSNANYSADGNNGHWLGSKIISQVKTLLNNPSLDVSSLIINKEMLKYDINERNAIYEEVHGVGYICPDESEPGMVETALQNLMEEIEKLPAKRQAVYQRALKKPNSYVHTRAFKLRFLRAELFDAKGAANRIVTFLETAVELFGEFATERPIKLSDFTKKELKVFYTGRLQLLPYRDRGGRRVIVGVPSQQHRNHDPVTRVSTVQAFVLLLFCVAVRFSCALLTSFLLLIVFKAKIHVYLWWIASESVETQRKGMILLIVHNPKITDASTPESDNRSGQDKQFFDEDAGTSKSDLGGLPSFQFAKIYVQRRKCLPLRMTAFHICTPDSPYYSIVRSFNTAMVKDERTRVKMHIGKFIRKNSYCQSIGIVWTIVSNQFHSMLHTIATNHTILYYRRRY